MGKKPTGIKPIKTKVSLAPNRPPENVELLPVGFKEQGSTGFELVLDDGTTIRVRTMIGAVHRTVGKYDPLGNPLYVVQSAMMMNVSSPANLRKKGGSR